MVAELNMVRKQPVGIRIIRRPECSGGTSSTPNSVAKPFGLGNDDGLIRLSFGEGDGGITRFRLGMDGITRNGDGITRFD